MNDSCICVKFKYENGTDPETITSDGGEVQDLHGYADCVFFVKDGTKRALFDSDDGIHWKPVEEKYLIISKNEENIKAAYIGCKRYIVCPTWNRVKIVEVEIQ